MTITTAPVPLEKATRLINHGPTVLVSAQAEGVTDVMAAAWCCALDFAPPKLTVVLDKASRTRELIERSGRFVIQIPPAALAALTLRLGNVSLRDAPDKLRDCGVTLFDIDKHGLPFVRGCVAWLACSLIPEPHNQHTYDLFIGEITHAWADARVFSQNRWQFEHAGDDWRTLHYMAGGRFYATGTALDVTPAAD